MENEQDSYNPYFSNSSASLIPSAINRHAIGLGETKPMQYFGRYNFTDTAQASKFLQSKDFLDYWNKNKVSDAGVAYRVQTKIDPNFTTTNASQRPNYAEAIASRDTFIEKAKANWKPNPYLIREIRNKDGTVSRTPVSIQEQTDTFNKNMEVAKNQRRNLARIDNRFYTPLESARSVSAPLDEYLKFSRNYQKNLGSEIVRLPIKVLLNENVPNYSLKGRFPFNDPNYRPEQFQQRMGGLEKSGSFITRLYGADLGATVSSNPEAEVFVPKTLSNTARRVGSVLPDGSIEIVGKPKVPIALQQAGNILSKAGTFMNYASIIPMVTSEWRRAKADYENPTTGEVYNSDEVTDIGGAKFADADLATRARFHPDNAENNPEITDEMRAKFYAELKKNKK